MPLSYRTSTGKVRVVETLGVVTDKTPENLLAAGWRCYGGFWCGRWFDPRTGIAYAISQAEAIRRDRLPPRYRFGT